MDNITNCHVFEYSLQPQYYDFDPSSLVHNATYVRWLEDARTAFQQTSPWPTERLYAADLTAVLTRTEIDYKAPIRLSDSVMVRLWMVHLGKSAWTVALRFVCPHSGKEYARAEQSGCYIKRSTGRPAPMPLEFVSYCRAYFERASHQE
jgi:acyl-CoA thioester hydrolase